MQQVTNFGNCIYFKESVIDIFMGRVARSLYRLRYGLEGPGIKPWWGVIFRPSGPALGPTQAPVQCVPRLSRGKGRPGRAADHSSPSSAMVMEG